ncbi:putative AlkP superfamily pyrophosphatase or phosphodiesterase [Friedmanniella endophytica]|uniref:Putative AlkP superfamily pyrophosphatase or phosphodiesterase n=1 Tax=Microlunatus kandeliicorticis TaxID=1759536 RepID=A0A7W3P4M7_9ACTN|nr:alkaline phosphatase family protein [Microlunatus kandeliicorticis]MBA8792975.1 putative AlkP superfamily pyrophosphatase or phosphodiesterase [Microlunatus kandeliicorticis]
MTRARRKLCLIGLDGLRWDVATEPGLAPGLMRLADEGSATPVWMVPPTDSGPGWSSLLTGCSHEQTRVWDNDMINHQLGACPDLLSLVWMRDHHAVTYAAATWRQLLDPHGRGPIVHTRIDQQRNGLHELFWADGELTGCVAADEEVQAAAARVIADRGPDAAFVYFEGVDEAGHRYGSAGAEYRAAITRVDGLLRCLVKAVDERRERHGEDWLIAVVTDHGHKPEGGHGGDEPEVRRSFLVLHCPGATLPALDTLDPTAVTPLLLDLTA